MRILRLLAAAAALASMLHPRPRDVRKTFELLKSGAALSASDADKLERRLEKKADDADARVQLLAYYAAPHAGADLTAIKAARARHIFWIIENDPKDGLGLFQVATGLYRLNCRGDELADSAAFARASDLWLEQVRKNPRDEELRRHVAETLRYCAPERAEELFMRSGDRTGLGRLYAGWVLGLGGASYVNGDASFSEEVRKSAFADHARAALEIAEDKELVVSAAGTLLRQGANLWADGKIDWDYTVPGNRLYERARKLAPEDLTLATVPTSLPSRGERPPLMIRVGGNVQRAKLVREAAPTYPPDARDRGIQGTVQMTTVVGLDGRILALRADQGPPELVDAAMAAVRQWVYQPTLLNRKPCYVETRIDVRFTLGR